MNGMSSAPRIWVILATCRRNRKQTATVMTLEITMVHTIANVTARWPLGAGVSIAGPGTKPWIRKAPMRIAMVTLAGTPKAMVVTRLPPSVELFAAPGPSTPSTRSEEHTSELQSHSDLVCRLLVEKKHET